MKDTRLTKEFYEQFVEISKHIKEKEVNMKESLSYIIISLRSRNADLVFGSAVNEFLEEVKRLYSLPDGKPTIQQMELVTHLTKRVESNKGNNPFDIKSKLATIDALDKIYTLGKNNIKFYNQEGLIKSIVKLPSTNKSLIKEVIKSIKMSTGEIDYYRNITTGLTHLQEKFEKESKMEKEKVFPVEDSTVLDIKALLKYTSHLFTDNPKYDSITLTKNGLYISADREPLPSLVANNFTFIFARALASSKIMDDASFSQLTIKVQRTGFKTLKVIILNQTSQPILDFELINSIKGSIKFRNVNTYKDGNPIYAGNSENPFPLLLINKSSTILKRSSLF